MISPDLLAQQGELPAKQDVVDLLYDCDGEVAWVFHVSRGFAQTHALRAGVMPLPDAPLDWIHELQCCCKKCFEETSHGFFDDRFAWHDLPT
jgi:hypothetical protein